MNKKELILKLKEKLASCALCRDNGCECVASGVGCRSDTCECMRKGHHAGEGKSDYRDCDNPYGQLLYNAEMVREYRATVLRALVDTPSPRKEAIVTK